MHLTLLSLLLIIASFFFTFLVEKICYKFKLAEEPNPNRWHHKSTAKHGGIAFATLYLITSSFTKLGNNYEVIIEKSFNFFSFGTSEAIIVSLFLITLFGFLDDILKLKPHTKVLGQLICIIIVITNGVAFTIFNNYFLNAFCSLGFLLFICNALNLIDNMDGLSSGVAITTSIPLILFSLDSSNEKTLISICIFTSCLIGFFLRNRHPAKIFMGDSGSQFIGLFLGIITILGTSPYASTLSMVVAYPLLILAIPIFDTVFVTFSRKAHGKSIKEGGKDHISHRLVLLGLTEKRAVNILISLNLISGISSYFLMKYFRWDLVIVSALIVHSILFINIAKILNKVKVYDHGKIHRIKQGQPTWISKLIIYYKKAFIELISDIFIVFSSIMISFYISRQLPEIDGIGGKLIFTILFIIITTGYFCGLYNDSDNYISNISIYKIIKSVFMSTIIILLFMPYIFPEFNIFFYIVNSILTLNFLIASRHGIQLIKEYIYRHNSTLKSVGIIISDDKDIEAVTTLIKLKFADKYKLTALLIKDSGSKVASLHGVKLFYEANEFYNFLKLNNISNIFMLKYGLDKFQKIF